MKFAIYAKEDWMSADKHKSPVQKGERERQLRAGELGQWLSQPNSRKSASAGSSPAPHPRKAQAAITREAGCSIRHVQRLSAAPETQLLIRDAGSGATLMCADLSSTEFAVKKSVL